MGNQSEGATHVTRLDIDISQLQKNVQVAQSLIDNLANNAVAQADRIKQAMNALSSAASNPSLQGQGGLGGSGSDNSGQAKAQAALKATTNSVKDLIGVYLNLQKAASATGSLQKDAFSTIDKAASKALTTLKDYEAILSRGGTLSKEQQSGFQQLATDAKTLSNEIKELTNQSTRMQQSASAENPIAKSMRQAREEVEKTAKSYNDFEAKLGKSNFSQSYQPFVNLFAGVKDARQQVEAIEQEIARTGTVTDEQIRKLVALDSQLQTYRSNYSAMLREAGETGVGLKSDALKVTLQDLEALSTKYQKLQQQTSKLNLKDAGFKNTSNEIRSATVELTALVDAARNTGTVTEQAASKFLVLKERASSFTEEMARFQTSDKTIQQFAQGVQKAENALSMLKKQTTLSQDFVPYQQLVAGAEQYVNALKAEHEQVIANGSATQQQIETLNNTNASVDRLTQGYTKLVNIANETGKGLAAGQFKIDTSTLDKAILQIQEFQRTVSGSGLKNSDAFKGLMDSSEAAKQKVIQLNDALKNNTMTVSEVQKAFQGVVTEMTSIKTSFAQMQTDQNMTNRSFNEMKTTIQTTINELKSLEKAATFRSSKQEAAQLRVEFQNLLDSVKSGTMSLSDAQSRLNELGAKFQDFSSRVQTGTTALQNFTNRIAESIKWRVAQTMVTSLYQSFTNLIKTIKETEDTVIGLQRVVNDPAISASGMQQELHDIAYEYGRTFDEAAETATKFAQTGLSWSDTMEATKASMLGLNVTELGLTAATDGLIAVMSQFGLEASELDDVINKVNITSDNFPVTAEKIVSALQRTGASAQAAGMTLEETIAVITALSEATGRSGENIGTALNSIIAFTSKDTALKTFADYLGTTLEQLKSEKPIEVWKQLGDAIKFDNDALAAMMAQSEEFAELFNADIAQALNLQEEYNAAVENQQDVYSQAGTYRKTYFIALLNDMDTAMAALEEMNNASGYSIAENEKTMESLSAKWNQLTTTAHELAVAFGEAGFMDFLKFMTELTRDTLKLVGDLGGLRTVLIAVAAAFVLVKKQKIVDVLSASATAVRMFATELMRGQTVTQAYGAAMEAAQVQVAGFSLSLKSIVGIAATVGIAIYSVVQHIQRMKEEAAAARKENIELAQDAMSSAKELARAYKDWKDAATTDDREQAQENLLRLLGYEKEDVDYLTREYGEMENGTHSLSEALDYLAEKKYEQLQLDAELFNEDNITPESLGLPAIEQATGHYQTMTEAERKAYEALQEFGFAAKTSGSMVGMWSTNFDLPEKLEDAEAELVRAKNALDKMDNSMSKNERATTSQRKATAAHIVVLEQWINALKDGQHGTEEMTQSFEDYIANLPEAEEGTQSLADALREASEEGNLASKRIDVLTKDMENLEKKFGEISGNIDDFQSAYSSIVGVIDEYNDSGYMTADMLQTLLSLEPQYLEMISAKNGVLSLNQDAVNNLMGVNDLYLVQLEALKVAEYVDALMKLADRAQTEGWTEAQFKAAVASELLAGNVAEAALMFLTGQDNGEELEKQMYSLGKQMGYSDETIQTMIGSTGGLIGNLQELNHMAGLDYTVNAKTIYTTEYKTIGSPPTAKDYSYASGSEMTYVQDYSKVTSDKWAWSTDAGNKSSTYSASSLKKDAAPTTSTFTASSLQNSAKSTNILMQDPTDGTISAYTLSPVGTPIQGDAQFTASSIQYGATSNVTSTNRDINRYYTPSDSKKSSSSSSSNKSSSSSSSSKSSSSSSSSKSSSSSSSSSKKEKDPQEEAAEAAKKAYDELIDTYEHSRKLLERNGSEAKDIIEVYRKEITATQEQIEKYKKLDVEDRDKYVRDLEEDIWDIEDAISEALASIHEAEFNAFENEMYLLEQKYTSATDRRDYSYMSENLKRQLEIQKQVMTTAHAEAQRLRELGVEENDDAIQECIQQYWDAREQVRTINKLIEADIMDAYSDFISFADSLNLWDYFDYSKLDYIRTQMEDINKLLEEGSITQEEYISLSKQWSVDYYNAQKEVIEARQEAAEEQYNETIRQYEAQKQVLDDEKEALQDYYNGLKEGYEAEIDTWEKRKDASDEYYDALIKDLQDVQKSNERINKQVDYFNSRSKIVTNIEQAQSRSGVEWRQKEMEYQQQLIELDENWNRTLQDWNLQDQISRLQELKELAAKDIEETITKINEEIDAIDKASEAAVKDIEVRQKEIEDLIKLTENEMQNEIDSIGNELDELSRRIAESIQNVIQNGIVNSQSEIDSAILTTQNTMLNSNDIINARVLESINDTAIGAWTIIDNNVLNPLQQKLDSIASGYLDTVNAADQTGMWIARNNETHQSSLLYPIETSQIAKEQISSPINVVQENGMDWIIRRPDPDQGHNVWDNQNNSVTNVFVNNEYSSPSEGAAGTQETLQWIIMNS